MSRLELDDVTVRYGKVTALDGLSLELTGPGIVGIIGPNGSGKTTLTNVVTGARRPARGRIRWDGHDVTRRPLHRITRLGLTRTFQHSMTFPALTVEQNLVAALEAVGRQRDEVDSLLAAEGTFPALHAYRGEPAGDLPFGHTRLLGVALAMVSGPRLIFLDEPAAGLNEVESRELASVLRTIADAGTALAVIDHDMAFLLPLCRRVVVLDAGALIADGTPEEVRNDPRVVSTYLGADFARG
jgi:ABC-type branched-subunit amino acid transport system ATPase component